MKVPSVLHLHGLLKVLVHEDLDLLRHLEQWDPVLTDHHLLPRPWVARHSPLPLLDLEAAESPYLNVLPLFHRVDDSGDEPIHDSLGFDLRQARCTGNRVDNVRFRQGRTSRLNMVTELMARPLGRSNEPV